MSTQTPVQVWTGISTATIASHLARHGFRNQFMAGLGSYGGRANCAGPAFTLRLVPTRADSPGARRGAFEDMLESVPAGHVVVIDAMGHPAAATIGDLMATRMVAKGIAGLISDGAVRDSAGLAQVPLAIHAAGLTSNLRSGVFDIAAIGQPVVCSGVTVMAGDLIVADADGPIAVPPGLADEIAGSAAEQERLEEYIAMRLRAGEPLEGLYPPTDPVRAAYESWRTGGSPKTQPLAAFRLGEGAL
jgi:regulator of RNase E activity RraA